MAEFNKVIKWLSLFLFVALSVVLVYESCMPASVSSEHSGAVGGAVLDVTEKIEGVVGGDNGAPTLSEQIKSNFGEFSRYIRKGIGHFGAFMVLAILGIIGLSLTNYKTIPLALISLIYGLFMATLTEAIQLVTPGRAGAVDDVLLDFFGYLCGATLVLIAIIIARITTAVKAKKKNKV